MIFPLSLPGLVIGGQILLVSVSSSLVTKSPSFCGPKPKPNSLDTGTRDGAVMFGQFFRLNYSTLV